MPTKTASSTARQAREAFAAAPWIGLDSLCGGGPVLVVAPHPDDETLGCGGLIALCADHGVEVAVATLTDGAASHPKSISHPSQRRAELRRQEQREALDILGGEGVHAHFFDAPDGRLNSRLDEAAAWLATLGEFASVFATWAADPHPDHKAAACAARIAAETWGARLYSYPVWGLTLGDDEDVGLLGGVWRLDIASLLCRKRHAIAAHRSQMDGLIADDPSGFQLSSADIARHLQQGEIFIETAD